MFQNMTSAEKNCSVFPDHAPACPAKITAGGRSHARQPNRIKEAARLGKQEGSIRGRQRGLQPIDIPRKFVAAGWLRRGTRVNIEGLESRCPKPPLQPRRCKSSA